MLSKQVLVSFSLNNLQKRNFIFIIYGKNSEIIWIMKIITEKKLVCISSFVLT